MLGALARLTGSAWGRGRALVLSGPALFVVTVGVRVVGALLVRRSSRTPFVTEDARRHFLPIARSLAASGRFANPEHVEWDDGRIAPLFPLWLALLLRAGGGELRPVLVVAAHALTRAAAVMLVRRIAAAFGPRVGTRAAALYLWDPWEALWTAVLIKDNVAVPLFLFAVRRVQILAAGPSGHGAAVAGAAIGAATLARFPVIVLLPAALLLLARAEAGARMRMEAAAILSLSTAFVVSGWVVRSPWLRRKGRDWFRLALGGRSQETFLAFDPSRGYADIHPTLRLPDGSLVDHHSGQRLPASSLLDLVRDHRRLGLRAVNLWRPVYAGAGQRAWLFLGAPYLVHAVLGLTGLLRARRAPGALAITAPLALLGGISLLTTSEIRSRQYLTPLLHVFGGLALAGEAGRGRR